MKANQLLFRTDYEKDIDMLQRIQRRETKMIPGLKDLSYEERLKKFGLTTLEKRQLTGDQIWRRIQECGLQVAYASDDDKFLRKILALCFLPAEHIILIFRCLEQEATTDALTPLLQYISRFRSKCGWCL